MGLRWQGTKLRGFIAVPFLRPVRSTIGAHDGRKIWQIHNQRGDPKAQMMGPNKQAHAGLCPCICGVMLIPFVNFIAPFIVAIANIENYGVMKTCQLARQRDGEVPAGVPEFTGDMSNEQNAAIRDDDPEAAQAQWLQKTDRTPSPSDHDVAILL